MEGTPTIQKAKKKPVEIEFIQFTDIESAHAISEWAKGKVKFKVSYNANIGYMYIDTIEGQMTADLNDYIIKGVHGEFYPCKPDIFHKTYEVL
ncbi:hypothetical protein ACWEXK_12330 [Staphylococcus xylosus]|uniref:hypothetical protein n=1 Tax=Staphylococcus xylosus TaxID=1288 RepID=UPI000D1D5AE1|nr:hypothetical protein [Staphylococcus xylosus]PTI18330.1 hypothetical protein BU115_12150 [Staphylococcus xylosus]HDP5827271.1 hypothetical protein [Staphylococcus aureus]